MSEEKPNLAPDEYVDLTRVMAASVRLLLLDNFWTREAQRASAAATADASRVDALGGVVDEMESLLLECRDLAPRLASIGGRADAGLQSRYTALVEGKLPDSASGKRAETLKRLREHVESKADGDPAAYLARASEALQSQAEKEAQQLREEFNRIRSGGGSVGDMSEETQEHVAALAVGAGLLLGPEAAGAVIVVAEIIDCLT